MAEVKFEKDLSCLSDEEAEKLVQERLQALKKETPKFGLASRTAEDADGEEMLTAGMAAIKGRRKDAVGFHAGLVEAGCDLMLMPMPLSLP